MAIEKTCPGSMIHACRAARLFFTSWTLSLFLLYFLNGSVPAQSTAKSPLPIPPLSVQAIEQANQQSSQSESLAEAARLSRQADNLNNQGLYDAAISVAERALAI